MLAKKENRAQRKQKHKGSEYAREKSTTSGKIRQYGVTAREKRPWKGRKTFPTNVKMEIAE